MNEICETCGLPKSLCVCGEIEKEQQKIRIKTEYARFRKILTVVEGLDDRAKAKELVKLLKRKLACGGTVKNTRIELQGDHRKKVKELLIAEGYKEKSIEG